MASHVLPRALPGEREEKLTRNSSWKSVQSDGSASLAQLVTGTSGSQSLQKDGHVFDAPDVCRSTSECHERERVESGKKYCALPDPWQYQRLDIEKAERFHPRSTSSGVRRQRWALAFIVLTTLSACALAYCVYLNERVKHQEDAMKAVISLLQNFVEKQNNSGDAGMVFGNDVPTFGEGVPGHRMKRSAADAIRQIEAIIGNYMRRLPMVHLRGLLKETTDWNYDHHLLWQQDPGRHGIAINDGAIRLVYQDNAHNRIKGIRVLQEGVYLVYAQVVIEGTEHLGPRSDCTHETIVVDHSQSNPKVLMKNYLTQDNHGRPLNDTGRYPRDTSFQMGLFSLLRQDEVRVRAPGGHDHDCRHINITSRDYDAAYFGLVKIA